MDERYKELSVEEKIEILVGDAEWQEKAAEFRISNYKTLRGDEANAEFLKGVYPPSEALADSWNYSLIEEVAYDIASEAKKNGVGTIIAPTIKPVNTPYAVGLSEDFKFITEVVSAYCKGVKKAGLSAVVEGMTFPPERALTGDKETDERTFAAYLKPLKYLSERKLIDGVILNDYSEAARVRGEVGNLLLYCDKAAGKDVVKCINENIRCLNGDRFYALNAYKKFVAMKENVKNGSATAEILRNQCENGELLSDESIEAAIEKHLSTTGRVINAEVSTDEKQRAERALKVAEETIVMLKNTDGVLPLTGVSSVAMVGNIASLKGLEEALEKMKISVYSCDGYDPDSEEITRLTDDDKNEIKKRNAVIFVADEKRKGGKSTKLPANRLAVIEELSRLKKKAVAIVLGNKGFDLSPLWEYKGLFVHRGVGERSGEALANILKGKISPSGRTSIGYSRDADEREELRRRCSNSAGTKEGVFFGYKYEDLSDLKSEYPFGSGIGYALTEILPDTNQTSGYLNAMLFNKGNMPTYEVLQIYVGKKNSDIVRPVKEFVYSVKVPIKSKSGARVKMPLFAEDIAVKTKGKYAVENGMYYVYVCKSSGEVIARKETYFTGQSVERTDKKRSDFVSARSNIVSKGFVIGEGESLVKNSKKLSLIAKTTFVAVMLFDAAILLLIKLGAISLGSGGILSALIIASLVISHIIAFSVIAVAISVKKKDALAEKLLEEIKRESFKDAEKVSGDDTDKLFKAQFTEEEAETEEENTFADKVTEFDKKLRMTEVAASLRVYSAERGIAVDMNEARTIISSLASSRFIYSYDLGETNAKLWANIARYFGGGLKVVSSEDNAERLLDEIQNFVSDDEDLIKIVFLDNLSTETVKKARYILSPYFNSPENVGKVFCSEEGRSDTYKVNPRLWVVASFKDETEFSSLPEDFLSGGVYLKTNARETAEEIEKTEIKPIGYYQFSTMVNNARDRYPADEGKYKEIDKYESRLSEFGFSLGNKNWQTIEKFVGTFLAADGEQDAAIDYLIASVILPRSKDALIAGGEENFALAAIDECFGKENVPESTKSVKFFAVKPRETVAEDKSDEEEAAEETENGKETENGENAEAENTEETEAEKEVAATEDDEKPAVETAEKETETAEEAKNN